MPPTELLYTASSSASSTTGAYSLSRFYSTLVKEPAYTDKDKQIFTDELKKQRIYLPSIDYDLNDFNQFIRFITVNPIIAPNKLGVYITKVMKYDDTLTNKLFKYPKTTHREKFGDCSGGAILCAYALEKAGYVRPVKKEHLPFKGQLVDKPYSRSPINENNDLPLQFPLMIAYSKEPLSKPVEESFYHAICVFQDPNTGLLNVLETCDGLTQTNSKYIGELLEKFQPKWQKAMLFQMSDGVAKAYPFVLIEKPAEKPAK